METLITIIREHVEYRKHILKLAKSDIVRTYRAAALGWSWAIIKPAFKIFVYWFAFAIGLRASKEIAGYPFFLWLIAGLIPWFYMNDILKQGIHSIKKYSYLVTKMRFPMSTIPTFVSISNVFIDLMLIAVMIIIYWVAGYPPDIYTLQLIFYTICMFVFFTLLAICLSPIVAMSKDFYNLVNSTIVGFFWLSGIMWDVNRIEILWLRKLLKINPITYICNGFRNSLVYKVWFWEEPKTLLAFCLLTFMVFIAAIFVYKRLRKDIPDVL